MIKSIPNINPNKERKIRNAIIAQGPEHRGVSQIQRGGKKKSLDMPNVAKDSLDNSCSFFLVTPSYDLLRNTLILDSRCSYHRCPNQD